MLVVVASMVTSPTGSGYQTFGRASNPTWAIVKFTSVPTVFDEIAVKRNVDAVDLLVGQRERRTAGPTMSICPATGPRNSRRG